MESGVAKPFGEDYIQTLGIDVTLSLLAGVCRESLLSYSIAFFVHPATQRRGGGAAPVEPASRRSKRQCRAAL